MQGVGQEVITGGYCGGTVGVLWGYCWDIGVLLGGILWSHCRALGKICGVHWILWGYCPNTQSTIIGSVLLLCCNMGGKETNGK